MGSGHSIHKTCVLARGVLLALFVLPLAGPVHVRAVDPGGVVQPSSGIEIEPQLLAQFETAPESSYLIYFRERPDLTPSFGMDWHERGWFVMKALQEAADRSQAGVRAHLDAHGASYEAFWIDNVIFVERSNLAAFEGLMSFLEIEAIRAERIMKEIEPVREELAPSASLFSVEPNIGHVKADQVWALGYRGEGVVVANIDSGVRYTHEALANQYRGNLGGGSFDHDYNWLGLASNSAVPIDDSSHGSHTMGTMVGDGGENNRIGMAPGAQWIACDACELGSCPGDKLLACAQWLAAPYPSGDPGSANPDMRPHVVNNSWANCSQYYDDWFQGSVDSWHAVGIYPIFSVGNSSGCGYSAPPGCNTVGNPARFGNVTAVGATGQANGVYASFSNWGPTDNPDTTNPRGYPNIKPQVVAPGISIRSSMGSDDSYYYYKNGTSMAAPHVAGLVALMWQAGPCLVGDYAATETILEMTANPIPYNTGCGGEGPGNVPNHATGWGEIDALAAVNGARAMCAPDFELAVTPESRDVCAGASATFDVEVASVNGFAEPVALSASGQPGGSTTSFVPNPVVVPGNSLLSIGVSGSSAAGGYAIGITGNSGGLVHQDGVTLQVYRTVPGIPVLMEPQNGGTGQPVHPTFGWQAVASATSYDVEIATGPCFSDIVDSATGLTETTYVPGNALNWEMIYYWRVRANNACGGKYSSTFAFRTSHAPDCSNQILNGDFESGASDWTQNRDLIGQWGIPHGGSWYAQLGGYKNAVDDLLQIVDIPAGSTGHLTYWYSIDSVQAICDYDRAGIKIDGTEINTYALCSANNTLGSPPYDQAVSIDMSAYAGTSPEIRFWATTDRYKELSTFRVDDVVMEVCSDVADTPADFSDLESCYGIAWHGGDGSFRLGSYYDPDTSFGPGDDNLTDDGVTFGGTSVWSPGGEVTIFANVQGGSGYLAAWFDWNGDGDFEDAQEKMIARNVYLGLNNISFTIPVGAGYTSYRAVKSRFRLYDSEPTGLMGLESTMGGTGDGEVEDYDYLPGVPTAVHLLRFEALPDDAAVRIEWETATEAGTLGFNLYRSDGPAGEREMLNDALISVQTPGSSDGGLYSWLDGMVEPGITYYYWLEEVDVLGVSTVYGPVPGAVKLWSERKLPIRRSVIPTLQASPPLEP